MRLNKFEKREVEIDELKTDEQKNSMTVEGYALKWGEDSKPIYTADSFFVESFVQGAFDETLKNDEQLVLYGHDMNNVLGRTENSTAMLTSDDIGLYLTVDLPNTTLGKDTYELVKRGDIAGMSVGFIAVEDDFSKEDETIKRTINKAKLVEVSLVPMPAYDSSEVSERAANNVATIIEQEKLDLEKRQRLMLLTTL